MKVAVDAEVAVKEKVSTGTPSLWTSNQIKILQ